MIYRENPNFVARKVQPNPREVSYWIDLTESPQGQIIKTWVSGKWVKINPSDASGEGLDLSEVQAAIANLTANKADKSEVYTKEETTDLIAASIEDVVDAAPGALDTLNELAAALNDDPNFATTIANTIAQKQDKLISGESIKTINGNSLLGSGNITIQAEGGDIDLSGYITTIEADNKYQPKGAYLTSIPPQYVTDTELEDYALKTDIPDTDRFITEEEANATYQPKGSYLTSVPAEYVTESELSQKGYATTEQIPDISTKQDTLVSGTNIKTINNQSILGQGNIEITTGTGGITDAPSDGNTYGRKDNTWQQITIPDTSVYATKEELLSKADTEDVESKLDKSVYDADKLTFALKSEIPTDYLTDEDLPDTSNFATKQEVQAKQDTLVSGTNIKTINGASILGEGNITIETPEGGLSDAASDGKLYGRKDGTWSEIVIPDTSGLATKTELSNKLDTETYNADKATFALKTEIPDTSTFITTETADSKYQPRGTYLTEVPDEYVTDTELTEQLALKANADELDNYLTIASATSTYATKTDLDSKLDTSTYTSDKATFATTAQLASKQDTLVSGTNIKTVNGQTILGEGNIQVETPEGGISDAPQDGKTYGRKDAQWSEIVIPDTSALATKTEIADMATQTWVGEQGYLTEHQDISNLATKEELASKANTSDLSNYLTTATAESTYAKKSEIPQQSLLPYDFFGTIDNYSTNSSITIDADSKYLSVYNVQSNKSLLDINFTNSLYKGVEYLVIVISNNYTLNVRPQGIGGQEVQVIGDTKSFSMQANQILEISAIRTDSTVICRVSSSSGYTDSVYDGIFG